MTIKTRNTIRLIATITADVIALALLTLPVAFIFFALDATSNLSK